NLIQTKRSRRAVTEDCPIELKAIVAKALAGNIDSRYQSAEAFENDLRGFIEGHSVVAAAEPASWNVNATIDKQVKTIGAETRRSPAKITSQTLVRALSRVRIRRLE